MATNCVVSNRLLCLAIHVNFRYPIDGEPSEEWIRSNIDPGDLRDYLIPAEGEPEKLTLEDKAIVDLIAICADVKEEWQPFRVLIGEQFVETVEEVSEELGPQRE